MQFIVTHTLRRAEIPPLLYSRVTNTPCLKILCPKKNCFSLYFPKNLTSLNVGLLRVDQICCVSRKIVYRCVATNCCFTKEIACPRRVSNHDSSVVGPIAYSLVSNKDSVRQGYHDSHLTLYFLNQIFLACYVSRLRHPT